MLPFLIRCTLSATHLSQRAKVRQAVICRIATVYHRCLGIDWVCGINALECLLMAFQRTFLKRTQAIAKIFLFTANVSFFPALAPLQAAKFGSSSTI